MSRNKQRTTDLLEEIARLTVRIQATFDEYEPEYSPNANLEFVRQILSLIEQEGPVWCEVLRYVASTYGLDERQLSNHLDDTLHATR